MPEPIRIFVSHHHSLEENHFTERLVNDLTNAGADVWVDLHGITFGNFVQKISEGLAGRQWLILVMTPASVQSTWVQYEVNTAIGEVNAKRMLGVIPFVMTPTADEDMPVLWRNLQRYDATRGYVSERDRLFEALQLKAAPTSQASQLVTRELAPTSTAPRRSWRRERVVDCQGTGDHTTIQQAIEAANAGERILIRKGVYYEDVTIDKPLSLVGDGKLGDVEICGGGGYTTHPVVVFQASRGYLTKLSILQSRVGIGLEIKSGNLEVENCDIRSWGSSQGTWSLAAGPGISIEGQGTNPHILHCHIHGANTGIIVINQATGVIEDCDIVNNTTSGVVAVHDGMPYVRKCRINRNRWAIYIMTDGGGIYEDNDLRGNTVGAWNIAQDGLNKVTRQGNIEE